MTGIICYIGIGSNLGNPMQNCRNAINDISRISGVQLIKVSSFYITEPVDITAGQYSKEILPGEDNNCDKGTKPKESSCENQNWFINAVAEIRTNLAARDLLQELQTIEKEMGRKRDVKGGPRIIDLDILFYGQDIINEDNLKVPHPGIHQRRFVLEPLCEIASFYIHPVFGISIRGLKDRLTDNKIVRIYEGNDESGRILC